MAVPAGRTAEDARRSRRSRMATAAALVIVFAAGLFASRSSAARGKAIESRRRDSVSAVVKNKTEKQKTVAPVAKSPRALTHEDSLAIAAAVEKRIADAEVARGSKVVKAMADSIRLEVQRVLIDSIVKTNVAHGMAIASATHPELKSIYGALPPGVKVTYTSPPFPTAADFPRAWVSGPKRVVITDPREYRSRPEVTAFGRVFVDSLRRTLMRRGGYAVVDQDSVRAVLARTRVREEVTKALHPDLLVSATFMPGDSIIMMVVSRDATGTVAGSGTRIATLKFSPNEPVRDLDIAIRSVLGHLEELRRAPRRVYKVDIPPVPKPPGQ
jgi:hypothetical protein